MIRGKSVQFLSFTNLTAMTPLYLRIFIIFFASFSVKCLALKKDGSIIIDRIQEQISSRRNWNEDGTDYPSPRESSRCNLNISPGNGYLCDPDQMIGPEDRKLFFKAKSF